MSNDGNRVIFESNSNINGGNGDGNYELYAFDRSSPNIVQLTNTQNFTDPSGAQVNVNNVLGEISGDG
ncbi:MAG: hypothetical protein J2P31_12695, partial [Blastocatellia bacterium]|nr:hypothetical protein [Blastocatellia bacterium]